MYERNEDIKTTLMPDGHVVLFNSKTEWAQVLNPMGALVWELCDGQTTEADMVAQIAQLLDLDDPVGLEKDIKSLIGELLGLGLVCQTSPSQTGKSS